MKINKKSTILVVLIIAAIGIPFAIAQTGDKEGCLWKGKGYGDHSMFKDLTEEQKEAMFEQMKELKESHASWEEIKEAKLEMMEELGIKVDETSWENHKGFKKFGKHWKGKYQDKAQEE